MYVFLLPALFCRSTFTSHVSTETNWSEAADLGEFWGVKKMFL